MIQSKWFWPSLIVLSALLVSSLSLTNSAFGLRPLAAFWFLLVCPGMAFVRLLPYKETVVQWTFAVALSLALDALVAAILVYAHIWSPNVALLILIAASLAGVSLQVKPERWLTIRKPARISLAVEAGELWYGKVIKSVAYRTANLKSTISSIPRALVPERKEVQRIRIVKILLVASNRIVYTPVLNLMQASGHDMLIARSGDEALNIVVEVKPDLILLDLAFPGIYDWDVLHRLRERSSIPIIILATNLDEADILHGFHLGADDYLTKPFSFAKLEATIAEVLSHSKTIYISKDRVTSGELTIEFKRKQVMTCGQKVNLTSTEYHLLETLARYANRTIPLSRLKTEVWGFSHERNEDYYRRFIGSLRKKIEMDPSQPKHLITRRGYGYRFV